MTTSQALKKARRLACDAFFLGLAVEVHGWIPMTHEVGLSELMCGVIELRKANAATVLS